jgi:cathepsin L
MKVLVLFALLFIGAFAIRTERQYQLEFTRWMQQHKKSYHQNEFQQKYSTFKANLDFIDSWNSDSTKTHKVAMNKFGDLSVDEFSQLYLGTRATVQVGDNVPQTSTVGLPDSLDWRNGNNPRSLNAVTGIKNQQQCGSCWSFSTTGSTEGCHAISGAKLVGLSEQNLMDCSTSQGNQGCNGGLMTQAMQYIISNGGIDTEASYPYTAEDGSCHYSASNSGATLKSFVNVNSGDEGDLQAKVYLGPTSVAIDASQSSFQFYSSGVYSDSACSTSQLDHGVLAVGWGKDSSSGSAYWIVKNSWGTDWGLNGYIWVIRNKDECGVSDEATYALAA